MLKKETEYKGTIVYIGGELPDKNAAAHRILSNAKVLSEYGYNLVFISEIKESSQSVILSDSGVLGFDTWYIRYPHSNKEWLKRVISASKYKDIISKYKDVAAVIYYDPSAIPLLSLKRFCKRKNIKLFSDCTEWHSSSHLKGIKRIVKSLDVNLTLRYAQKKIDGIIVISSFWNKIYKKQNTLTLLPLIDLQDSKWQNDFRESDVLSFAYAGAPGYTKDRLNTILEALYEFREIPFSFDIVGVTQDDYLGMYPEHSTIVSDMSDKVNFHGRKPHQETLGFVKKADFSFLIRPSTRKNNAGFPTKFGESIACGTPVIASHFSDVAPIVEKYSLGILVEDSETASIKKGLEKVFAMNRDEIRQLKERCLNCTLFDYRTYSDKLGNFIEVTK